LADLSSSSDDYERTTPKLDVKLTDYGFQYSGIRKSNDGYWVRVYQYIMPATQIRGRIAPRARRKIASENPPHQRPLLGTDR